MAEVLLRGKPFLSYIPQVAMPGREVLFRKRVIYTIISLLIFLSGTHLPLYGVHSLNAKYSVSWLRAIFASNPGTLMELSIDPIFMMALLTQSLVSSKLIRMDVDRALLSALQKLLGVLMALGMAVVYVLSGAKDTVWVVVFHYSLSPISEAFFRQNLPNVTNLLATALVFVITIYFQGFYILLPVASTSTGQQQGSCKIKLFMSNIPVFILSAFVSSLYLSSQVLYRIVLILLGKWQKSENSVCQFSPFCGIASITTASFSMADMVASPFRAAFYVIFMLSASALLSRAWVEVSGSSAKDVAEQLEEQHMGMLKNRQSKLHRELSRYLLKVAPFGGIFVGALIVLAEFMGVGVEILLAATIMPKYSSDFCIQGSHYSWIC